MVSGLEADYAQSDLGFGRSQLFDQLLPQHAALLTASAISDAVAAARGYRSVTEKVELRSLGFSQNQARVPALLLPVWDVTGKIALYQARPDEPRVEKGKPVKYETLAGSRMTLDVPPSVRGRLVPHAATSGSEWWTSALMRQGLAGRAFRLCQRR
ncbi:MAG: hypothetical protein ABSG37_12785 [Candidatus Limnocylindrales bacterium]|jgi:hypothetical protein